MLAEAQFRVKWPYFRRNQPFGSIPPNSIAKIMCDATITAASAAIVSQDFFHPREIWATKQNGRRKSPAVFVHAKLS
jgi:hypothetical protein